MARESRQHTLDRVRSPRVHITYDVEIGDALEMKEIPFVVGVLADLTGKPEDPLPKMKDRKFIEIDRDNFNSVMEGMAPRLAYRVDNKLADDDSQLWIGCDSGLILFSKINDGGQFENRFRITTVNQFPTVRDVAIAGDAIWCATDNGLAVADRRDAVFLASGPVDRHRLTDHIEVADHDFRVLALIGQVLGRAADDRSRIDVVVLAQRAASHQRDVVLQLRTPSDRHVRPDDGKRANFDIHVNFSPGVNERRLGDLCGHCPVPLPVEDNRRGFRSLRRLPLFTRTLTPCQQSTHQFRV